MADAERPAPDHTPPADATCRENWGTSGATHACSWISHEGDVHKCVCGDVWRAGVSGCHAKPVMAVGSYDWWRAEVARRDEELGQLRAERDLLCETLAETDLGAQVLAQWEAIAAADADRDRLEAERDELKGEVGILRRDLNMWTSQATAAESERDTLKAANEQVGERLDWLIANGFGATTDTLVGLRAALDTPSAPESPRENPIEALAKAGPAIWEAKHEPVRVFVRCARHAKAWSGNWEMFQDCPDCHKEPIEPESPESEKATDG